MLFKPFSKVLDDVRLISKYLHQKPEQYMCKHIAQKAIDYAEEF